MSERSQKLKHLISGKLFDDNLEEEQSAELGWFSAYIIDEAGGPPFIQLYIFIRDEWDHPENFEYWLSYYGWAIKDIETQCKDLGYDPKGTELIVTEINVSEERKEKFTFGDLLD